MSDERTNETGRGRRFGGMGLRARLTIALGAMVLLILLVGVTSFVIHERMRDQVVDLGSSHGVDLREVDLDSVGLELEGFWDPAGSFVADDVVLVRALERPKLRGAVEAVDAARKTMTLYGVTIGVPDDVERLDEGARVELLRPGQRVEVICEVEDGRWHAEKLRTEDVKASDKIKGTVTESDLDGAAPETVTIHGLLVSLAPSTQTGPEGAMRHVEAATRMVIALESCRSAAQRVTAPDADAASHPSRTADLEATVEDFEDALTDAGTPRVARSDSRPADAYARLLHLMRERRATLRDEADRVAALAPVDPAGARELVAETLEPLIADDLLPLVYAYRSAAVDDLDDQLRNIVARTTVTTRVALASSGVATLAALVLGLFVWRSIQRPIVALRQAAARIGRGDLDTRVGWHSPDELGELARAFDKMAAELARSTVSVAEKELLLREVHHRVKNNMQVISSLLGLQSIQAGDERTVGTLAESQSRIRSMALIHEQLYRSDELERIDLEAYLARLANHLSQALSSSSVRVDLSVEDVELDIDRALACGLIVNELVTNAFKHAFADGESGTVRITLRSVGEADVELAVADDGTGNGEHEADPGSLGTRLVATLAQQLGGAVRVAREGGTVVRVTFPLHEELATT